MAKRLTKAARIAKEKAALYARLRDMALGAVGAGIDSEEYPDCELQMNFDYRQLGDFMNAVSIEFSIGLQTETDSDGIKPWARRCLTYPSYLHRWQSLESLTDLLYDAGVRAW